MKQQLSISRTKAKALLQSLLLEIQQARFNERHLVEVYSDILSHASSQPVIELKVGAK